MFLMCGAVGTVIYRARDPKNAPKGAHVTHFVVHMPKSQPACTLRAYLLLGGHTDMYFDSGDETQQKIWALAKECGGSITIEQPPHSDFYPHGPARNG